MLKEQAIKGIKWTSLAAVSANILQLLQLVIVSKFVSAADYGLMSLTLVIAYFAQLLGDMGFSNALIYKKNPDTTAFSSLFWLSVFFCWMMVLLLFFIAPLLAVFFKQPLLPAVIRLTALSFILLPLQMQYGAVLKKDLQFNKIAMADIAAKLIALLVAVIMAVRGYGVFALVYSTIAGVVATSLLYFYSGRRGASLSFVFVPAAIRDLLHFGIYQTGNDILSYIIFQADTLILGKILQIDAVGFYAFAKNLAIKPTQVINQVFTQVGFPLLAKVNDTSEATRRIYLKMVNYLAMLNFLIYPFIAVFAPLIIRVFFAAQWLPAVPALQWLSLFCMLRSIFNPVGILLSAGGRVKQLFYWNAILVFIMPVAVYFAAAGGIVRVAIVLSISLVVLFLPMWRYLVYPASKASLGALWLAIQAPLLASAAIFFLLLAFNLLPFSSGKIKIALALVYWTFASMALTWLFNKSLFREAQQQLRQQLSNAGWQVGGH